MAGYSITKSDLNLGLRLHTFQLVWYRDGMATEPLRTLNIA